MKSTGKILISRFKFGFRFSNIQMTTGKSLLF